jgi:hypothetical protein
LQVAAVVTLKAVALRDMVVAVKVAAVWAPIMALVKLTIQNVMVKPTLVVVAAAAVIIQAVAVMVALE